MKYIYKITNLINNKIYIGQSKDVNRRWREHCLNSVSNNNENRYLYSSMRKYGINNFKIEIIEGPIENYNEREKYWISFYNSNKKECGYNMTEGGENPPITKGDNCSLTKYSDELILKLQKELNSTNNSFEKIGLKYGVSCEYLSLINLGKIRKDENKNYPLRPSPNIRKDREIVEKIIYELLFSVSSIESIAKKFNIDSDTIYKINKGQHFYNIRELVYPIRSPHNLISNYLLENIYLDLQENKLKFSEIEKKYNLSKATINRINQGKSYKNNNFIYPIRSSKQRVYN